jgi:hypothetical protein
MLANSLARVVCMREAMLFNSKLYWLEVLPVEVLPAPVFGWCLGLVWNSWDSGAWDCGFTGWFGSLVGFSRSFSVGSPRSFSVGSPEF